MLMNLVHKLISMDQSRLTVESINFDRVEGQTWMNCVLQEQVKELDNELSETRAT